MPDTTPILMSNGSPSRPGARIAIIDFVRGLAVALMALDHTRDFFTSVHFAPEDLEKTWPLLFVVRWVTHFCAPAFFLLMGTGAFLYGQKVGRSRLRKFLLTRSVWLVLLEFTVVGFAWTFTPGWGMFGVIWALGASLLLLACVVDLPFSIIVGLAVVVIAGHDMFDKVEPRSLGAFRNFYIILHRAGAVTLFGPRIRVLFPLVPWSMVTMLGYGIGPVFQEAGPARRRTFVLTGAGLLILFVILRTTNLFGNPDATLALTTPGDFHLEPTISKTLILFLDVEKYPPSLQYLLMTLGPILLLLSVDLHQPRLFLNRMMITFGRTPLFFYVFHLYLIHLAAVVLAVVTHQSWRWLLHGAFFLQYTPENYGHNLGWVFGAWVAVLIALYPVCRWYEEVKAARGWWWLKYV